MPPLIINTVSSQVAENLALLEAHIEGALAVDADIAEVVVEPLLRDVVVLVDLPLGFGVLLSVLTHLLLHVDLPEVVVELRITTRKD